MLATPLYDAQYRRAFFFRTLIRAIFLRMKYEKPPLSLAQQLDLLESRGLLVSDRKAAETSLSNISYYRLSAYMLPYKEPGQDRFKSGTSFEQILHTYVFDRELRMLVFDTIEPIEIAFRTQAIYHPSMELGAFWYEVESNFQVGMSVVEQLAVIDEKVSRSKETFIEHFKSRYTAQERPPAWMLFEILSFGQLTTLVFNLSSYSARNAIASHFGFPGTQRHIFESWIQSIVYVRNICAHHSRLWNRKLVYQPSHLAKTQFHWISNKQVTNTKIFYFLSALLFLTKRITADTRFAKRLLALIDAHPDVPVSEMDFPNDWKEQPLWKDALS